MGIGVPSTCMSEGWEDRATQWIAWARRPNFDAYWLYRGSFLDHVVPQPGRMTLDIGCGEGRVSRDLVSRGHSVTGIDASPSLVAAALAADPSSRYEVAQAEDLPFPDAAFDVVVSYNALMDVDDMPAAVSEASRVLAPNGRIAVCVTHPVADSGRFVDDSQSADFVIGDSYFGERQFNDSVERDGLTMRFDGRAFDLESYSTAFERAGLAIELLREPTPAPNVDIDAPGKERWSRIPMFLMARLRKA